MCASADKYDSSSTIAKDPEIAVTGWAAPGALEACLADPGPYPAIPNFITGVPSVRMLLTSSEGEAYPYCREYRYAKDFQAWVDNFNFGSS